LSGPGLDDDAERTGGFSPVTPRFFESAACGCKLIGIYPQNEDFLYFRINEICANVSDYKSFRNLVLRYLNDQSIPEYAEVLGLHLTSKRAAELLTKLSSTYAK
jgi:hypothetical protein